MALITAPPSGTSNPVNLTDVPASQDTLFIRGFRGDMELEDIRGFFEREGGKCMFVSIKYSVDKKFVWVALKFRSPKIASLIMQQFDGAAVLGCILNITYYKDIRSYAVQKRLADAEARVGQSAVSAGLLGPAPHSILGAPPPASTIEQRPNWSTSRFANIAAQMEERLSQITAARAAMAASREALPSFKRLRSPSPPPSQASYHQQPASQQNFASPQASNNFPSSSTSSVSPNFNLSSADLLKLIASLNSGGAGDQQQRPTDSRNTSYEDDLLGTSAASSSAGYPGDQDRGAAARRPLLTGPLPSASSIQAAIAAASMAKSPAAAKQQQPTKPILPSAQHHHQAAPQKQQVDPAAALREYLGGGGGSSDPSTASGGFNLIELAARMAAAQQNPKQQTVKRSALPLIQQPEPPPKRVLLNAFEPSRDVQLEYVTPGGVLGGGGAPQQQPMSCNAELLLKMLIEERESVAQQEKVIEYLQQQIVERFG